MPKKLSIPGGSSPRAMRTTMTLPTKKRGSRQTDKSAQISYRFHDAEWALKNGRGEKVLPREGVRGRSSLSMLRDMLDPDTCPGSVTGHSPTHRAKQARGDAKCRAAHNPPVEEAEYIPIVTKRDRLERRQRAAVKVMADAGDIRQVRSVMASTVRRVELSNPPEKSPRHKPWVEVE